MRAIFIADAHLKKPDDPNYRKLLEFLESITGKTDILIIAGDFFEFWIGDEPQAFPHYAPAIEALNKLCKSGTKIIYIEGNHDFHLGGYFSRELGADVHPDEATLELDGRRIYLCHGDLINKKDYGYMALRFIFRNRFTRLLVKLLPYSLPAWVAQRLGDHSKGKHKATAARWDASGITGDFAMKRAAEGFDLIVTAHYHKPRLAELGDGRQLLALGDWISQFSYGEMIDGKLCLKHYTPDL